MQKTENPSETTAPQCDRSDGVGDCAPIEYVGIPHCVLNELSWLWDDVEAERIKYDALTTESRAEPPRSQPRSAS